jgi:hypothetical protein
MSLTATEQFAMNSMTEKIHDDWKASCKEADTEINAAYDRIAREGNEHQDEGFIQQSIEKIKDVKRNVSEARRMKNQRLEDIRNVRTMLGGHKD